MLRLSQGWFKRRSPSGKVPESKPETESSPGHKPTIYEEAVSWENARHDAMEKSEARPWSLVRWTSVLALLAMAALVILAPFYKAVMTGLLLLL